MNCEIIIQNLHPNCLIPSAVWVEWFETWLVQPDLDLPVATDYELSLRLTDDAEVQQLNSQYRQQDQPTDVLAFAALENNMPLIPSQSLPLYLGDIIISVDTAQRQALDHQQALNMELAWLASHGFLHLLGWDHPDEESLLKMLEYQQQLLGTINVS